MAQGKPGIRNKKECLSMTRRVVLSFWRRPDYPIELIRATKNMEEGRKIGNRKKEILS